MTRSLTIKGQILFNIINRKNFISKDYFNFIFKTMERISTLSNQINFAKKNNYYTVAIL